MKPLSLFLILCFALPSNAQDGPSKIEVEIDKNLIGGLMTSQVQGQLELVDDQEKKIKRLADALMQRHEELKQEMLQFQKSGVTVEQSKEMQAELQAILDEEKRKSRDAMLGELLPHQESRLRETVAQLVARRAVRKNKVAASLLVPEVRDYLEIKEGQAKRIGEKAKKLQKEIAEKLKKLQQEAQKELFAELDGKQKEKYRKLFGESIPIDHGM